MVKFFHSNYNKLILKISKNEAPAEEKPAEDKPADDKPAEGNIFVFLKLKKSSITYV